MNPPLLSFVGGFTLACKSLVALSKKKIRNGLDKCYTNPYSCTHKRIAQRGSRIKGKEMNTKFEINDTVKAELSVQGMIAGNLYTISNVITYHLPFGTFVSYKISDGVNELGIANGHFLLTKVFIAKKRGA